MLYNLLNYVETWKWISNLWSVSDGNENKTYHELEKRMKKRIDLFNKDTFHPYKAHILTVKSKQLLYLINRVSSIKEKMAFLEKCP